MSTGTEQQDSISRRTVLRRGAILSATLGLASAATTGQAAAMNKAELIEAMASQAGLSPSVIQRVLDTLAVETTKALKKGDRIQIAEAGTFGISKRAARTGRNPKPNKGGKADSAVLFDVCPEFAAALDLNPGKGDEASAKCGDADVVIDADSLARAAGDGSDRGLSKADAKKALDGLVSVTVRALKRGETASWGVGFGSFSISKRSARTGRNPQTGKKSQSSAKEEVKFKAGAELSKAVN